ncbi:glycosyltransferase family 39 protein [Nocardioides sp. B-3]|uniref:glycosyltransferase family 39 protein n=1 Tax=Nocardioides sp. B-3 TaxID=2895565 RepID=UPI0021528697|nr:glycosyltransferase family 39 protein [Nocardioides sp. B-3]UUZ60008.1 glycosyltransferase family 39 protein [Nocardioides sp. B-3]
MQGFSGWQRQALLLIAFVLVAAPLVGFRAVNDKPLSVLDELQYADRVHAVAQGHLFMREGEAVSRWAHVVRACRGVTGVGEPTRPPCRPGPNPEVLINYAASDPVPYFVATGLMAGALEKSGVVDDGPAAARLVGIVWAGLSMWTLWLLTRAFGTGRAASLVVASTVVPVPVFLQQYTKVTPHAPDIPVGAFAAPATLRYLRREWPVWVLVLAAVAIVGVKGSNVVAAVAIGITLAAVVLWPNTIERGARARAVVGGVVLTVSTVGLLIGHQWLLSATRIADHPPPGNFVVERLDWFYVTRDSVKFLSSWGESGPVAPGAWLVLALGGPAMVTRAGLIPDLPAYVRQFAPGYLPGALLGAVVLDVIVFVTTQQQFGVHVRYGLAVFPDRPRPGGAPAAHACGGRARVPVPGPLRSPARHLLPRHDCGLR